MCVDISNCSYHQESARVSRLRNSGAFVCGPSRGSGFGSVRKRRIDVTAKQAEGQFYEGVFDEARRSAVVEQID